LKYQSVYEAETSIEELALLAKTAGAKVCGQFVVRLQNINPKSFIGAGKISEIKEFIEKKQEETGEEFDIVIFDEELSGVQLRNLEEMFGLPVIDRTQLILHIFAMRARTQEGMLEVELAQLEYLMPRLIGLGKVLSRTGGGIGTRGPGETKLEADRRKIRTRISKVKEDLENIKQHRSLHRRLRSEFPFPQVSLVGYTNAGKSTLLNSLSGAEVLAKDQLFSTLDTTTKKIKLPGSALEILMTDTVGFINKLPHKLVMSFRATLEEVNHADLLLHVVDASNYDYKEQIEAVNIVLKEIEAQDKPAVLVFNKIDAGDVIDTSLYQNVSFVKISARHYRGFEELYAEIEKHFVKFIGEYHLKVPFTEGKLISFLRGYSRILDEKQLENDIEFKIKMYKRYENMIANYLVK